MFSPYNTVFFHPNPLKIITPLEPVEEGERLEGGVDKVYQVWDQGRIWEAEKKIKFFFLVARPLRGEGG